MRQARQEKIDPADAQDSSETFLPGQIPVGDADSAQADEARRTEQQPDPAEAAAAVNPELIPAEEERKSGD
jgi:hypothetical protein